METRNSQSHSVHLFALPWSHMRDLSQRHSDKIGARRSGEIRILDSIGGVDSRSVSRKQIKNFDAGVSMSEGVTACTALASAGGATDRFSLTSDICRDCRDMSTAIRT